MILHKFYLCQHQFDENPKEFDVECACIDDALAAMHLSGHFIIQDGADTYLYPECGNIELKNPTITITRTIQGGENIFASVLAVALIVVGSAFEFATAGLSTGLIIAGTSMLVGVGVSVLFTPNQPNVPSLNSSTLKNSYGIQGTKNEIAMGKPFPVIFGKHRTTPPIIGAYYTSQSNNNGDGAQYSNVLFALGYGDLAVRDIRIGDNELAKNTAGIMNGFISTTGSYVADIEIRQAGHSASLYPFKVYEQNIAAEIQYDADFVPSNTFLTIENTTEIVVGVIFQGLVRFDNQGNTGTATAPIEFWYRPAASTNAADWKLGASQEFSNNQNEVLRYQLNKAIPETELALNPSKKWEVYVRRTQPNSETTTVINKAIWGFLQSKTDQDPIESDAADKLTILAMRILANDATSGQLDSITCECSSLLPIKTSASNWDTIAETSNPAAIYRAICLGKYASRAQTTDMLDNVAINNFYDWCETNQRTCNAIISDAEPTRDILNKVLSVAQARFYLKNGLYSLSHDKEKTNPVAILNQKNSRNFQAVKNFSSNFDGIDATFIDASAGYKATNEVFYPVNIAASAGDILQKMDIFGTTNQAQACAIARYILACQQYRSECYTLDVGIENVKIPIGSLVEVSHDVLSVGLYTGRILNWGEDAGGYYLALDETINTAGIVSDIGIKIFCQSSESVIVIPCTPPVGVNTLKKIYINQDPAALGLTEFDTYAIGYLDNETLSCFVDNKEPLDDMGATLTLYPYNDAIYDAANSAPPPYNPRVYDTTIGQTKVYNTDGTSAQTKLTIENLGQVFFDFNEYTHAVDTGQDYFYNRGNIRNVARFNYNPANITLESDYNSGRGLTNNWLVQDGNYNYAFNVDNSMYKSNTISFMLRNIDLVENKKWIFYYQDATNKNELGLFVQNSTLNFVLNSWEQVLDWGDAAEAKLFSLVRDFDNSAIRIYRDKTLIFEGTLSADYLQLADEVEDNLLVADNSITTGLTTEKAPIFVLGADRSVQFNLCGNGSDGTGASFDIADFHIWDIPADTLLIDSIFNIGIIPMQTIKTSLYLGEFPLPPQRAKLGDSFLYTGTTNDLFFTGSYYQLGINGWSRIEFTTEI